MDVELGNSIDSSEEATITSFQLYRHIHALPGFLPLSFRFSDHHSKPKKTKHYQLLNDGYHFEETRMWV